MEETRMMYYFSTVDSVVMTHSEIKTDRDGFRYVLVRFEQDTHDGFKIAEATLPNRIFHKIQGFTEDEMFDLEDYLLYNHAQIWEFALTGGGMHD